MGQTEAKSARPNPTAEDQAKKVAAFQETYSRLSDNLGKVIVGHREVIRQVLLGLLAGGHVLLEGVPGIGKTLLVKTVAQSLELNFSRIQFTPDLMPADIVGTHILTKGREGSHRLEFQPGPIFGQIILADEINRATPKTQSALLEAMEESSVTVARLRHDLPQPFFVLATQNPLEMEGTFRLPEAQLDRFILKTNIGAASVADLEEILDRNSGPTHVKVDPVADAKEIIKQQLLAREVVLAAPLKNYVSRIVAATHPEGEDSPARCRKYVKYGASPRGALAIALTSKVSALTQGRAHVAVSDIQSVCAPALRHRISISFEGIADDVTPDDLIDDVLSAVPRP